MKTELPNKARRPVPSVRLARLAGVMPVRASFAVGRKQRPAVRGSALPGRFARRCSPPTAATDEHSDVSMLINWPLIRGGCIRSYELQNDTQMRATKWRSKCRRISGCNKAQVWPKPPPHAVNVLLALFPLRSTLTATAFRPRLLLGSGFGKFKAGALCFQREHKWVTMQRTAAAVTEVTRLLELYSCAVRSGSRVKAQSITIGKPSPFPLAFRVALLASSEACPNLSGRVLHSVILGLPLGALAAAPGCMKMLCIFSSRLPGHMLMGCSPSLRGRAIRAPEGGAIQPFHFMIPQLPSTPDVLPNSARRMTGTPLEPQREQPPEERWPTARRKIEME
jgi:hypothetical protein